jgi:hypothetical protein
MRTAVATSQTPSETDASTDATARPRPALVLAYGAEHIPRIRRARTVRSSFGCAFSNAGMCREWAFPDVLPRLKLAAVIRPSEQ